MADALPNPDAFYSPEAIAERQAERENLHRTFVTAMAERQLEPFHKAIQTIVGHHFLQIARIAEALADRTIEQINSTPLKPEEVDLFVAEMRAATPKEPK